MTKRRVERFHKAGNLPFPWWLVGRGLVYSAEVLYGAAVVSIPIDPNDPESTTVEMDEVANREFNRAQALLGPTLMLRAFGVEAMLKALYVDQGGVLAKNGKFIWPPGKSHDLCALAIAAKFDLDANETELLRILEFWSTEGRYPIQTGVDRYDLAGPDAEPMSWSWTDENEDEWRMLVGRLRAIAKSRWKVWATPDS